MRIRNMTGKFADYDFTFGTAANGVTTLVANLKGVPNDRASLTGSDLLNFTTEAYLVDYEGKRLVNVNAAKGDSPAPEADPVKRVTVEFVSGRREVME